MTASRALRDLTRLDTWRNAGLSPSLAAFGCLVASKLVDPEKTFTFIGGNQLSQAFHEDVAGRLGRCRTLNDFEAFFKRNADVLAALPGDPEALVGTKQLAAYMPLAFTPGPIAALHEFRQTAPLRTWEEANGFLAAVLKPPLPATGSGVTAEALCKKYGLSSLAMGPAVDVQPLLDRLDVSLARVARRMGVEDSELGGGGRLGVHMTVPCGGATGLTGECRAFTNETALLSLPVDYAERVLDHELLHFHDALASFACDPSRQPACLSNFADEVSHPVAHGVSALLRQYEARHPKLMQDLRSMDLAVHGTPYWTQPTEMLARAFGDQFSATPERLYASAKPAFVEDRAQWAQAFLQLIRPAVKQYLAAHPLPWMPTPSAATASPPPLSPPASSISSEATVRAPSSLRNRVQQLLRRIPDAAKEIWRPESFQECTPSETPRRRHDFR